MERTDYPAMLAMLQPAQAVDILNDRMRQVGRLNSEIADWLQERRRLEEHYSSGLRKLARKQIDGVDLGIFSVPWVTLTNSAENLAESHSALALKIEVDVERPLRDFAGSNREMQAMTTMQGNLGALAREVDRARQKADKLQNRGDTGKIASASSELEGAQSQWESQAPYVFENLQAVDETRLNHLRDVLTQYQTHEVDQVEKSRVTAEHCLNVLLNIETADEIKTFALKTVANKPRAEQASRPTPPTQATPSRASSSALTPTISQPDEASSQRSGSVQEEKKSKGPLKGLKRLGTVMSRRNRESKMPSQLAPMPESPERHPKSSPFNSFSGRFGKSKDTPTLEPPAESSTRPRSPLRMGSEVLDVPSRRDAPTSPSQSQRPNGISSPTSAATPAAGYSNIPNGSHQGDLADLEPPRPSEPVAPLQRTVEEPERDSEGYSVPSRDVDPISQAQQGAASFGEGATPQFNVNIRNAPIEEEGGVDRDAALANMASKLQMQAPPVTQRRLGTVRGRREARNSYMPPPREQGTQISAPEAEPRASSAGPASPMAPETTQGPIERSVPAFEQAAPSSPSPIQPSAPSAFAPVQAAAASTFSPFPSGNEPTSPFRPASRTAALNADHTGNDNQSIRSGRSLTSVGSQGLRHPELHQTGLNSSIVETVSARFENGKLLSSSLIGEVAMAYNPPDFSSPFGAETIRLDNFSNLEKVAPNPAFIISSSGKEGEYTVSLANIAKTQVAFKYQARLDDNGWMAPLLITPAFRIEASQASIIVSYSLNPSFTLPQGRESITLSNVTLGLTLEGAKATSCQSKPVGTFAREKNLIFWQLGDVVLSPGAAPHKLLARFATESEAKSGSVEARWEISGEGLAGLGSGIAVSMLGQSGAAVDGVDPFADVDEVHGTSNWKEVQGMKKMVSGHYAAK